MNYRPVDGWGRLPEGWSYVEATSVAVDQKDNVYVFNRGTHPIIVFDREGRFLRSWGEGVFRRPHGVTLGPDATLWLTDDLHHTIRQFTLEGKLLLTIGDPDTPSTLHGGKPFNRPTHVALDPKTGDVYVSDGYGTSRVHKVDSKGRHLVSWGEPGTDPGCFNIPHSIATDADGLVYVADRENHRVQVFDAKGRYLAQINNLHRPCGLYCDRRDGGVLFVGELPTHLPVNQEVPNLGARVSVLTLKGDLVGRVGARARAAVRRPRARRRRRHGAPARVPAARRRALRGGPGAHRRHHGAAAGRAAGARAPPGRRRPHRALGAGARRVVRAHARRRQAVSVRDRAGVLRPPLRGLAPHAPPARRRHERRRGQAPPRAPVAPRRSRASALGRSGEGPGPSHPAARGVGAAPRTLPRTGLRAPPRGAAEGRGRPGRARADARLDPARQQDREELPLPRLQGGYVLRQRCRRARRARGSSPRRHDPLQRRDALAVDPRRRRAHRQGLRARPRDRRDVPLASRGAGPAGARVSGAHCQPRTS